MGVITNHEVYLPIRFPNKVVFSGLARNWQYTGLLLSKWMANTALGDICKQDPTYPFNAGIRVQMIYIA